MRTVFMRSDFLHLNRFSAFDHGNVVFTEAVCQRLGKDFLIGLPQQCIEPKLKQFFKTSIHKLVAPFEIFDVHTVFGVVENRSQSILTLDQRLARLFPFRNIDGRTDK